MLERLRRGSSDEHKAEPVADMMEHAFERKVDKVVRPGLNPKLQRALRGQNNDGQMAYVKALVEQRDDPPKRADGSPLRLGLVDPETGLVVQPPGETYNEADAEIDDEDPGPYTPPPPPLPPSVA